MATNANRISNWICELNARSGICGEAHVDDMVTRARLLYFFVTFVVFVHLSMRAKNSPHDALQPRTRSNIANAMTTATKLLECTMNFEA